MRADSGFHVLQGFLGTEALDLQQQVANFTRLWIRN